MGDEMTEPIKLPDLEGMAEAFSRVIEAHRERTSPFYSPAVSDADVALRELRSLRFAIEQATADLQVALRTSQSTACKVIERLQAERDEALKATADLRANRDYWYEACQKAYQERDGASLQNTILEEELRDRIAERDEARAELARLVTLRPASEHRGELAAWYLPNGKGFIEVSLSKFRKDGCYWTPLPPVKEADK
jgi:hypothetical protein